MNSSTLLTQYLPTLQPNQIHDELWFLRTTRTKWWLAIYSVMQAYQYKHMERGQEKLDIVLGCVCSNWNEPPKSFFHLVFYFFDSQLQETNSVMTVRSWKGTTSGWQITLKHHCLQKSWSTNKTVLWNIKYKHPSYLFFNMKRS